MIEVTETVVKQIVNKIYRDANTQMSGEYFIILKYTDVDFKDLIDPNSFKQLISFLPNMNYKGMPFIMSVVYSKFENNYEVTVHNPRVKF